MTIERCRHGCRYQEAIARPMARPAAVGDRDGHMDPYPECMVFGLNIAGCACMVVKGVNFSVNIIIFLVSLSY